MKENPDFGIDTFEPRMYEHVEVIKPERNWLEAFSNAKVIQPPSSYRIVQQRILDCLSCMTSYHSLHSSSSEGEFVVRVALLL